MSAAERFVSAASRGFPSIHDHYAVQSAGGFSALAVALLRAKGGMAALETKAKHKDFHDIPQLSALVPRAVLAGTLDFGRIDFKSVSDPGTTEPSSWAAGLSAYRQLANGFIDTLPPISAFDRMLSSTVQVPLRTGLVITEITGTADVIAEGVAQSITEMKIGSAGIDDLKAVGIVVVSDETLRMTLAAGTRLVSRGLRSTVATATTERFVEILLDGVAADSSSGDPLQDLRTMLGKMNPAAGDFYWLLSPQSVINLATAEDSLGHARFPNMTARGGIIQGVTVLPAPGLEGTSDGTERTLLVNAAEVGAASEDIALDVSDAALLQLNTAPVNDATAVNRSLFAEGLQALKATRHFGAVKLRTTAVAAIEDVDYGSES